MITDSETDKVLVVHDGDNYQPANSVGKFAFAIIVAIVLLTIAGGAWFVVSYYQDKNEKDRVIDQLVGGLTTSQEDVLTLRKQLTDKGIRPNAPAPNLSIIQGAAGVAGAQGLPGARGPRGVQGSPGLPGEPGPKGDQGTLGPDGKEGSQGPSGKGESGASGPKGDPGPPGPEGAPGPAGPQGEQGPMPVTGECTAVGPPLSQQTFMCTFTNTPPSAP